MAKYYVRQKMTLHKVNIAADGRKTTQIFQESSLVDLTSEEFEQYKHLLETEEQYKTRNKSSRGKSEN